MRNIKANIRCRQEWTWNRWHHISRSADYLPQGDIGGGNVVVTAGECEAALKTTQDIKSMTPSPQVNSSVLDPIDLYEQSEVLERCPEPHVSLLRAQKHTGNVFLGMNVRWGEKEILNRCIEK